MEILIFNILLYALYAYYLRKHFRPDMTAMIMPYMYLATSIISLLYYLPNASLYHLNIGGFIYLFVVYIISATSFVRAPFNPENPIVLSKDFAVNCLAFAYVVSSVIVLMTSIPKSIAAFQFGDWLAIRNEMYWGENETYSTFGERIAINLSGYLRFFSIFYFFFLLTKIREHKNKIVVYTLGVLSFLPSFLSAVTLAARGTLFQLIIEFAVCFFIFRKHLDRKTINQFRVIAIGVLSIITLLTIAITLSRFDTDSSSSVLFYLGHSMLTFDYGVYDTTIECANGKWLLGDYSAYFTGDKSELVLSKLGAHCGSAFITMFGSLYIDFGFWGTILFVCIFSWIISLCFKRTSGMSNFGRVFFYAYLISFFMGGVFVYPVTFGIRFLFNFFIYILISRVCSTVR